MRRLCGDGISGTTVKPVWTSRRTPAGPVDPYQVTAEFYDLFHREHYQRRARCQLTSAAAGARHGILEVGAGTGLVTEVLVDASTTPVHAVEPSRSMRSQLLGRLAASPRLRRRVCVHAEPVQRLWLPDRPDLAVCVNVLATVPPAKRPGMWNALAALLRPGGLLAMEYADREPVPGVQPLPSIQVGGAEYTGSVIVAPADEPHRYRWTYLYQVRQGAATVREETEFFDLWWMPPERLREQLDAAGFEPAGGADGLAFHRLR